MTNIYRQAHILELPLYTWALGKGRCMTDSTNNSSALNPVEQFDMYVAHVGINASNADEAEKIANLFTPHFLQGPW